MVVVPLLAAVAGWEVSCRYKPRTRKTTERDDLFFPCYLFFPPFRLFEFKHSNSNYYPTQILDIRNRQLLITQRNIKTCQEDVLTRVKSRLISGDRSGVLWPHLMVLRAG